MAEQRPCPGRDDMELPPGDWVACEHPERPPDERMCSFPAQCHPCEIATEAAIRLEARSG